MRMIILAAPGIPEAPFDDAGLGFEYAEIWARGWVSKRSKWGYKSGAFFASGSSSMFLRSRWTPKKLRGTFYLCARRTLSEMRVRAFSKRARSQVIRVDAWRAVKMLGKGCLRQCFEFLHLPVLAKKMTPNDKTRRKVVKCAMVVYSFFFFS